MDTSIKEASGDKENLKKNQQKIKQIKATE